MPPLVESEFSAIRCGEHASQLCVHEGEIQEIKMRVFLIVISFFLFFCGTAKTQQVPLWIPAQDADTLKLVTLLSQRVDCIRNAADRKKFFLAHPELEVRYSFANFIE